MHDSHENDNEFVRELELDDGCEATLKFVQMNVGDVNCVIWDAAIVLAKYLDLSNKNDRWLRGKNILELGAGLGCVGLAAACLGANVVLTDLEENLPLLKKNIKINEEAWKNLGGRAEAKVLKWGKEIKFDFKPDVVLLADCVYYEESVQSLLDTLEIFCGADCGAYAILAQEERDTPKQVIVWKQFLSKLKGRFKIEHIPINQQHPTYSSKDICLLKICKANK